jgi:hypothetical protein
MPTQSAGRHQPKTEDFVRWTDVDNQLRGSPWEADDEELKVSEGNVLQHPK